MRDGHRHCRERRFARDELHERGFGRHGRHGRHGGGGRLFDHGELRLLVLAMIGEKPRYGYEIIKAIEERTGGSYSPSPGVVYPTLTMLEELGHATIEASESGKKLYAITPEGTAMLEASRTALEAIRRRTAEAGAAFGGAAKAPLMRAMENLRLAVRLRMAQGPLDEEQARAIAAVIDRAALEVERS